jgi:hypothetical protein
MMTEPSGSKEEWDNTALIGFIVGVLSASGCLA